MASSERWGGLGEERRSLPPSPTKLPRKLAPDVWLFGVAIVLLSVGAVMV